jgi:hypothetical protein
VLRDVLERIGKSYIDARAASFQGHSLAQFIRQDGPDEIAHTLGDPGLISKGGCGVSGQWAYVPWIGLFDPAITEGAQRGFYIVYLFSADMKRVYLSVNQGTTEVQSELGSGEKTFDELRSRAAIMRERTSELRIRLNTKKLILPLTDFFLEAMKPVMLSVVSIKLHLCRRRMIFCVTSERHYISIEH